MHIFTGDDWYPTKGSRRTRVRKEACPQSSVEANAEKQATFERNMRDFGFNWETTVFMDEVAVDNRTTNKAYAWVPEGSLSRCKSIFIRGLPETNEFPATNSVVVMDNCAVHDRVALGQCAFDNGIGLVFLPPYSPQYNPIESLFNTIKTWIKSNRVAVSKADPYDSGSGSYSLFEFSSCPARKISRKRIKSTAIFDLVDSAEANICTRGCSYLIFY
eukprot:gene520-1933_t